MTNNYYTILPAEIRYDRRLLANAKLIYSEILSLSRKNGYCHASNSYFAKIMGASITSVSKWINSLIAYGYLRVEYKYLKNTKHIDQRRLYVEEGLDIKANFKGDIKADFKENNTSINNTSKNKISISSKQTLISLWNQLGGKVRKIKANKVVDYKLQSLVEEFGEVEVKKAIQAIGESSFLKGEINNFLISFNWFSSKDNFLKVLRGTYVNFKKEEPNAQEAKTTIADLARKRRMEQMLELRKKYMDEENTKKSPPIPENFNINKIPARA